METKFNALCALVALQNWKSYNFQIAKQSNLSSKSEFLFGSRSQSLNATLLIGGSPKPAKISTLAIIMSV